jgi:DNA repair protein RecO (recombination protein O)
VTARASGRRVWLAPAYILHQYAYRDTSRIVEAFTAEHGRLSLFARGANGPKSRFGVLRPFQRLLLSWSGKGEACQLAGAELDGAASNLPTGRLMSGFYVNELLLKLTERWDPHPEVFDAYARCLAALGGGDGQEASLRCFEKRLLDNLGYGLELTRTSSGEPIEADGFYRFAAQRGPEPCAAEAPGALNGRSLADLEAERFADERSLRDAKRVLRAALDACLDGRTLRSREVMLEMHRRDRGVVLDGRAPDEVPQVRP